MLFQLSKCVWAVFLGSLLIPVATSKCTSDVQPKLIQLDNYTVSHLDTSQDTKSWGMRLSMGDNGQTVILVPSTVVNNTLLMSSELCSNDLPIARCESKRGGTFNYNASGSGFTLLPLSNASLAPDPGWAQIMEKDPPFDIAGNISLNLPGDDNLAKFTVAVVTQGRNHTNGHLGLGIDSSILRDLTNAGLIPTMGFGLNAGSQSVLKPRAGNLILGGYDQASVTDSFRDFSMTYPIKVPGGRICPLQVTISSLKLRLSGQPDTILSDPTSPFPACIEPYDNLFRLSSGMLDTIKSKTGWSNATTIDESQFLVTEPGLYYPASAGFSGTLVLQLQNDQGQNLEVAIPPEEMFHPTRGLDVNGVWRLQDNITQVNIFNQSLNNAVVLGKVFLSQVYLAVNYEARQFKLGSVAQRELSPSPVPFLSNDKGCTGPGLSSGAKAAIAVSTVFAVTLLGAVGWWLYWRRQRARRPAPMPDREVEAVGLHERTPTPVVEADARTASLTPAETPEYRHQLAAD